MSSGDQLAAERKGGPRPKRGVRYNPPYHQNPQGQPGQSMAFGCACGAEAGLTLSLKCSDCHTDKEIENLPYDFEATYENLRAMAPGLCVKKEVQIRAVSFDEGFKRGVAHATSGAANDDGAFDFGVKTGVPIGLYWGFDLGFRYGEENGWALRSHATTAFASRRRPDDTGTAPAEEDPGRARGEEVRRRKQVDCMERLVKKNEQLKEEIRQDMRQRELLMTSCCLHCYGVITGEAFQ